MSPLPPGEPLLWATNLVGVESTLSAKGVVLQDGRKRYVLCAIDWCLLGNDSELSFRQSLARAARTRPDRVAIHCVHQHSAPYADEGARSLLASAPSPKQHLSKAFLDEIRQSLSSAARQALSRMQPFDQVGYGSAPVQGVASARRLRQPDGKILTRFSSGGKSPALAAAPEGDVDTQIRTVTFARANQPLVRLHYYSTHPQTFCCDGRASSDFVGAAREALQAREQVFQVYFTGCSGDVTVGKYNDGSPGAYHALQERLLSGMQTAIANTRFVPAKSLVWRTQQLVLPLRGMEADVQAESLTWLNDPKQPDGFRVYKGAMRLAYIARKDRPVQVSSLQVGNLWFVHLPGEPMLEFARFAHQLRPSEPVVVAGYGDCGPAYICTDAALTEGGYEPEATNVGPGSEAVLKSAIQKLLAVEPGRN